MEYFSVWVQCSGKAVWIGQIAIDGETTWCDSVLLDCVPDVERGVLMRTCRHLDQSDRQSLSYQGYTVLKD